MTAQDARNITEATNSLPRGMKIVLSEIKYQCHQGNFELFVRFLNDEDKVWLEQNGYTVTETDKVFYAGSPSQKAVKITW